MQSDIDHLSLRLHIQKPDIVQVWLKQKWTNKTSEYHNVQCGKIHIMPHLHYTHETAVQRFSIGLCRAAHVGEALWTWPHNLMWLNVPYCLLLQTYPESQHTYFASFYMCFSGYPTWHPEGINCAFKFGPTILSDLETAVERIEKVLVQQPTAHWSLKADIVMPQ